MVCSGVYLHSYLENNRAPQSTDSPPPRPSGLYDNVLYSKCKGKGGKKILALTSAAVCINLFASMPAKKNHIRLLFFSTFPDSSSGSRFGSGLGGGEPGG